MIRVGDLVIVTEKRSIYYGMIGKVIYFGKILPNIISVQLPGFSHLVQFTEGDLKKNAEGKKITISTN